MSAPPSALSWRTVVAIRVDQIEADEACGRIIQMTAASSDGMRGRSVCAANVHMAMEAWDFPSFAKVVNGADLVLADGQPMVWALRLLGSPQKRRVRVAPDLLIQLFAEAERQGIPLGLYGGTPETLRVFTDWLTAHYPRLGIACAISPPFRPPTPREDERDVALIRKAGVQLLLVGIGCPKQERWMAEHRDQLPCVMFGVGAAFDQLGGRTKNAPRWTRDIGLEWAYRLAAEPRRLWRRYLRHNPRFVLLLARQLLMERTGR